VVEVVGRYPGEDRVSVECRDPGGKEAIRIVAPECWAVVVIVSEDTCAEADVEGEGEGPSEQTRASVGNEHHRGEQYKCPKERSVVRVEARPHEEMIAIDWR
jgi:hypothetical protein